MIATELMADLSKEDQMAVGSSSPFKLTGRTLIFLAQVS